jgi:hypothetical protein
MDFEMGCLTVALWCVSFSVYLLYIRMWVGACHKKMDIFKTYMFSNHESVLCVQFTAEKQKETGQALYYSSLPHQPARHTGVSHRQRGYLLSNIRVFGHRNDDILSRSCLLAERGNVLAA